MAQRLLLEGPDIDELLERVRVEHGPDARIVHAEQKLVGGVAGFFARRRFEVAVAVDDEDDVQLPRFELRTAALPIRLPRQQVATIQQEPIQQEPIEQAPIEQAPIEQHVKEIPQVTTLDDLLAAADAHDGDRRSPGRTVSTETASFDHLVRDLVARAEPEVRVQQPQAFAATVPRVIAEPVTHDLPAGSREPSTARPFGVDESVPVVAEQPAAADEPAEAVAEQPAEAVAEPGGYLGRHSRRARRVPAAIVALGLPIPPEEQTEADPRTALLDILTGIAVDPPRRLSGVQVVVGAPSRARAVAREWLAQCGEDPDGAVVDLTGADGLRPAEDAAAVAGRIARVAERFGGVVVVVPAGDTRVLARRAGRRIAELGAVTVTAVVDARWHASTTRQWLAALAERGAAVDALAGYGVQECAEPLRLLEYDRSVTWLDAHPATLGAWAAPCLDRWQ